MKDIQLKWLLIELRAPTDLILPCTCIALYIQYLLRLPIVYSSFKVFRVAGGLAQDYAVSFAKQKYSNLNCTCTES